jgi:hypothetical protein
MRLEANIIQHILLMESPRKSIIISKTQKYK